MTTELLEKNQQMIQKLAARRTIRRLHKTKQPIPHDLREAAGRRTTPLPVSPKKKIEQLVTTVLG